MYEFRKVRIRGARRFYFVGALLFRDNVQTHLGGGGGGGGGASNRDITVYVSVNLPSLVQIMAWRQAII